MSIFRDKFEHCRPIPVKSTMKILRRNRSRLLRIVFIVAACALTNAFAREHRQDPQNDVDPKTGIAFPVHVGSFQRERGIEYGDAGYPEAAYTLPSRMLLASVFYYKEAPFAAEYASARDAVKQKNPSARLISDRPSNLHPSGRHAIFTCDGKPFGDPGAKYMTELLMFPHRDMYLTFRITYPARDVGRTRREIDQFVRKFTLP
jgi:hypothetical protein